MKIDEMASTPRSHRTAMLLKHYREIESALAMGWTWREIGRALGLESRGLRDAFVRLKRRIESGKLKLSNQPIPNPQHPSPRKPDSSRRPGGTLNPKPPARKQEPKSPPSPAKENQAQGDEEYFSF